MVHHGIIAVCIKHREVNHWGPCNVCGEADIYLSPKWRAPTKSNDLAWKRIAKGEYYWDRKAKSQRAQRTRSLYPWVRRTRKESSAAQIAHIRRAYNLGDDQ